MTLSFDDAARLRDAGFNEWEIQQLSQAHTPTGIDQPPVDLNAPAWQRTMQSRRDWIGDKRTAGWREEDIDAEIMAYYARSPKRNPFDFLKAEYKPPLKKDFFDSVRQRARRKIKPSLAGYY